MPLSWLLSRLPRLLLRPRSGAMPMPGRTDRGNWGYRTDRSYRSYWSCWSDRADGGNGKYRTNWAHWGDRPSGNYRGDRTDRSYWGDRSYGDDWSYGAYRFHWNYWTYWGHRPGVINQTCRTTIIKLKKESNLFF